MNAIIFPLSLLAIQVLCALSAFGSTSNELTSSPAKNLSGFHHFEGLPLDLQREVISFLSRKRQCAGLARASKLTNSLSAHGERVRACFCHNPKVGFLYLAEPDATEAKGALPRWLRGQEKRAVSDFVDHIFSANAETNLEELYDKFLERTNLAPKDEISHDAGCHHVKKSAMSSFAYMFTDLLLWRVIRDRVMKKVTLRIMAQFCNPDLDEDWDEDWDEELVEPSNPSDSKAQAKYQFAKHVGPYAWLSVGGFVWAQIWYDQQAQPFEVLEFDEIAEAQLARIIDRFEIKIDAFIDNLNLAAALPAEGLVNTLKSPIERISLIYLFAWNVLRRSKAVATVRRDVQIDMFYNEDKQRIACQLASIQIPADDDHMFVKRGLLFLRESLDNATEVMKNVSDQQ